MRFAVAHKAATYLMVGCAYLAMTTGGGVPPAITLGGVVALIGSWWWEPPRIRFERWSWPWTAASVLALAYCAVTAVVTGDVLGAGAQLLVWLVVAKAFNRRAARDWQQLYLLAFLMLIAGSVLNPELTYGLCFLGFVIASTWALTLFHLRREMEDNLLVKHSGARASEPVGVQRILDSRRIVAGRFFLGTGLLSLAVFLGAAAVFLALPRVGVGFFVKARGGLTLAGFADGTKLGGHGVIKNDPRVVMRVELAAAHGSRAAAAIHWRGVAFDHYARGRWTRSAQAPTTQKTLEQRRTRDRWYLPWDGPRLSSPEIDELAGSLVKQEIWLEPLDSDVLFGATLPRIVEYPHVLRARRNPIEHNDELRLAHGSTIHYTVYSQLAPPPPDTLRTAVGPLPPGFEVYTQLDEPGKPPEITARTRDTALEITRGLTNDYDRAVAIQRWLTSNYTYTLELADPGEREPVDFFLFERKQGHCEYFASAFAVLARINGIPVRQVNGFLGGEWNEYQGYVAVRAGDAHAWTEVYFPGQGWVTFDATPAASVDQLGRGGTGWRARLGRYLDTLRFQWSKWVIEYDLASQLALFKRIGRALADGAAAVKAAATDHARRALAAWPIVAAAVAGAAALTLWRRRKRRARQGTDRASAARRAARRARSRSTIAAAYDQAARALARAGVTRDDAVTPRELAAALAERGEPTAPQVVELTELYYAAAWGGRHDVAAAERATELARAIREQLAAARRAR